MLRKPWRLLILLVGLFVLFACATEPEAPPEEPEPEPMEEPEPEVPAPVAQRSEAEELRDAVLAYDLARFAPDTFEAGEENFEAAEAAFEVDNEMARQEYEAAIDRYNEVVDAGIAGLREEKTDEFRSSTSGPNGLLGLPPRLSKRASMKRLIGSLIRRSGGTTRRTVRLWSCVSRLRQP